MSRKLLAFLLSELATVRVKCPNPDCGIISELTIELMGKLSGGECKFCGQSLGFPRAEGSRNNAYMLIADGIKQIQAARNANTHPVAEIEFIIPEPPPTK